MQDIHSLFKIIQVIMQGCVFYFDLQNAKYLFLKINRERPAWF
jgi:hypothetical protein